MPIDLQEEMCSIVVLYYKIIKYPANKTAVSPHNDQLENFIQEAKFHPRTGQEGPEV